MSQIHCSNCDKPIPENEVCSGFNETLCDNCFSDKYTYCDCCDTLLLRSRALYNNGDPYCDECYTENDEDEDDEDYDSDAPVNPEVSDLDRTDIITLSRYNLLNKKADRFPVSIKPSDYFLKEIREQIGFVDSPVYLYGLADSHEYHVTATEDLYEQTVDFLKDTKYKTEKLHTGKRKIGFSLKLRKENRDLIVNLIKSVSVKEAVCAA